MFESKSIFKENFIGATFNSKFKIFSLMDVLIMTKSYNELKAHLCDTHNNVDFIIIHNLQNYCRIYFKCL